MTRHKQPAISASLADNRQQAYISRIIEDNGQQYFLPYGEGPVEGSFNGRIRFQTLEGDMLVTCYPISSPVSHVPEGVMRELIHPEMDENEVLF